MTHLSSFGSHGFRIYLGALGAGHTATGLQLILFPWLMVGVLGESPERVGLAQMLVLLPNLLFVLWGGALSDNRNLSSHLFRLYLLYTLPFIFLIVASLLTELSFWLVIVFGLSFGMVTPFAQPAKESLLAQVTKQAMHGAVAKATFVQFSANSVGVLLAGYFDQLGLYPLVIAQIICLITAALLFRACSVDASDSTKERNSRRDIVSGLRLVLRRKALLNLLLLVAITGFLGLGAYMVAIPFLVRDIYQAGPTLFAALQFSFMMGVVVANVGLIRLHYLLQRPGRAMMISLLLRAVILILIAQQLPEGWVIALVFLWGCFSGISMTLGRSFAHMESPLEYRARTLSIYQLCLLGSAPLGAWVVGQMIDRAGVLLSIQWLGLAALIATVLLAVIGPLWNHKPQQQAQ